MPLGKLQGTGTHWVVSNYLLLAKAGWIPGLDGLPLPTTPAQREHVLDNYVSTK